MQWSSVKFFMVLETSTLFSTEYGITYFKAKTVLPIAGNQE
jgi:hypothetical protein